jgi:hypothetical protein
MHIAAMPATTPARSHNDFISLQTCFLDMGFPPPATKIEPEAILCFFAHFRILRHRFCGKRAVLSLQPDLRAAPARSALFPR